MLFAPSFPRATPSGITSKGNSRKTTVYESTFLYGSADFADAVVGVDIHRDERARESPSDHVPVSVEIETNGDDDDRPMVF
jgi:hypothetical protein